jgi:thiol-disulfide isomerase/thioredoxin
VGEKLNSKMINKTILYKSGVIFIASLLFFTNNLYSQTPLKEGLWKGSLQLNDSIKLPFEFEIKKQSGKYFLEIINAEEKIKVDEVTFTDDSVFIKMPVFDSEFRCKLVGTSNFKGAWINHSRKDKNVIPFEAKNLYPDGVYAKGDSIFFSSPNKKSIYEATFNANSEDSYKAIGFFREQNFYYVTGTFLTETGDYRYLSGTRSGGKFSLSTFDGSHAFLFTGEVKGDSIINGHFYSGAHSHEPWVAVRNEKFQLRNPDSLTYLKSGYSKFDFNFKNLEGKKVSLSDEKFKNKVIVVQLMGSWCPNCMDETRYLASFYSNYKSKGLEVVALAFERTNDFNKAVSNVKRLKTRFNAEYEFLITEKTGKDQASEVLPMLNAVMAFPTTIYIDKKGIVRKIYTGFYGPATGNNHTKFVEETNRFIEKLLAE